MVRCDGEVVVPVLDRQAGHTVLLAGSQSVQYSPRHGTVNISTTAGEPHNINIIIIGRFGK